jgi:hypothetical protein
MLAQWHVPTTAGWFDELVKLDVSDCTTRAPAGTV